MAKQGAKTATPRLRFPEYRGADGWTPTLLGELGTFIRGLTYGAADVQDDGLLVVRSTNIQAGQLILDKDPVFVEKNCSPEQLLQVGDIAICMSNGSKSLVGKSAEFYGNYEGAVTVGAFCSIFRPSLTFTKLAFKSDRYAEFVAQAIGGGNINNLKNSDLESFEFAIPVFPDEQQKIADCLTSLDEVIAAQGRKLEALKAHKRGLMQQLFPREGETRPRLRFPEFRNAPEWRKTPLGRIAEIKLGKMLDANKHTTGHLLPYVNNLSLRWNEVDTSDLPKMYFKEGELERFGLRKGDVLVCEGGEPGRSAVWDGRLPDLKFQKAVHRVRFKVPFVPKILVLYLEAIAGTAAFESLFTGGGIKHLTGETFSKLSIPLTIFLEQQRISDCFASLDTQITAETNQLAALKTHKQGLMQQLFPAPEAMRV